MIPPPNGQDSSAWCTTSPSPYTAVSSNPTTSTRKRMSANISDLGGEPGARGETGEVDEVADEVRLVGVPAGRRDGGAGQVREHPPRAVEADHPRRGLRRQTDLRVEPGGQVPFAPADRPRDVGDPHCAVRGA
jgi:hypothetical protein